MKKAIALFLLFLISVVSVFVVQLVITKLWNFAGISWGPGNLPVEPIQKIAMLSSTFIAGLFAPIVAITVYRKVPWVVIFAICVLGLTIDVFAALVPLATLPVWFKIVFVVSVPLQVILGTTIGIGLLGVEDKVAQPS
ncbi:hypothetical protein PVT68_14780 [Microbulbifer bruguierae]|uniref:Uncharacterized protein n=1 Tax=Microbulbifer bruguierae TaxID=3029061 RepID=A0ABY8NAU3_9GAMM|nr:hypothetical protein [Microbulbifer bruguierae]WGL16028.1 hypothetical protein PVT68_14780 [Microbulbifer bruguierae]